jgi:hypothetical protein
MDGSFQDGVEDYTRLYCLVAIAMAIGCGICTNIKAFYLCSAEGLYSDNVLFASYGL